MSLTSKITTGHAVAGSGTVSGSVQDVAASLIAFDQAFPAASSNVIATMAFTLTNVQSFLFLSDQNATIKTNSSGSPTDTISLVAGVPFAWSRSAGYYAMPFSGNVTTIYVSCTPAAHVQARILTN